MLTKKLKWALMGVLVADVLGLILEYKAIYCILFTCGWSSYDIINFG
jgi:hypothetical protein